MVQAITKTHMDILLLISDYVSTIKLISERLKIPRSTIKRRIDELLEHHYITKTPYENQRVYLITSKGSAAMTIFSSTPESARNVDGEVLKAHKVQWSAVIVEKPWELNDELVKNSFTVSSHKNWDKYTFYDHNEDLTIVFNPNKVHIFLHEFFINSPMEYYPLAQEKCVQVCTMLMEKFPGLKLGKPKKLFTVHSQHIVKQGGPLAKAFEHHAEVTGVAQVYHGKNLDIDHSQGVWEEETKDSKVAPAHMEDLGYFFDKWLEQPFFPADFNDVKNKVSVNEQSIIASEVKVNELSHQMSASESSIKHEMTLQHSTLRKDMELLGRGLLELGQGLNKLNEGHVVLGKGQEILQSNLHDMNDSLQEFNVSLDKLYISHEAQNANMNTFAVAMEEHVALIKALQGNAAGFNKGLAMLSKSHEEMLGLIKEMRKPWYVKLSESFKKWGFSRKKNKINK